MYWINIIDRVLAEQGHSVLQLPSYHPDLNLNKLLQTIVRTWIADSNVTFRMEDLLKLTDGKIGSVSKGNWKLRCDHVISMEAQYVTIGALLEEGPEIVVDMGNDSSDSILVASEEGDDGVGVLSVGLYSIFLVN
jgi:hypothetical protein